MNAPTDLPSVSAGTHRLAGHLAVEIPGGFQRVLLSYIDQPAIAVARIPMGVENVPEKSIELRYEIGDAIELAAKVMQGDAGVLKKPGAARILASAVLILGDQCVRMKARGNS